MQLTLELPDELVDRLEIAPNSMSRHVLETLTVVAYQAERITSAKWVGFWVWLHGGKLMLS
jgi:hypothetical protein